MPALASTDLPEAIGKPGSKTRQPGDIEQTRALRALVRKTASKAEELASTPTAQTGLLGLLLGIGANRGLADLTAAVMLADKRVLEPVDHLLLIASTDPLEAGVLVANWSRPQLKAVWGLLDALDVNLPGAQPPVDHTKAVMAAAKAILTTPAEALEVLRATAALIPGRRL